jgi:hypothetical protein
MVGKTRHGEPERSLRKRPPSLSRRLHHRVPSCPSLLASFGTVRVQDSDKRVEELTRAVARLMQGMYQETGLSYMANMYLTPTATQGFIEHTDNKDGIILQVGASNGGVQPPSFEANRAPARADRWKGPSIG